MTYQYFIVGIIVLIVIFWQWKEYNKIDSRITRIKNLFPSSDESYELVTGDEEEDDDYTSVQDVDTEYEIEDIDDDIEDDYESSIYIESDYNESAFNETIEDINLYLSNNECNTYDYQIIKEIVNRKSKSLEEEVDTLISVPLYLGLLATIFGIAFGVVVFAWKDLQGLLSGNVLNAEGIKILLTDVGIAMGASLVGVYCTKKLTSNYNEAKTQMAKNKDVFLTWIQTQPELMSNMSDDLTTAIQKMTSDLNNFNKTFAKNTAELKKVLGSVSANFEGQVRLLDAIERLKITKIAKANIEVYDRLQGCTDELEKLFITFSNSEQYLSKVIELNNNIGTIEERTRLFEELGNYFKNEIDFVRERQGMMRQQMSSIDSVLQDGLQSLGDSLKNSLGELRTVFQTQNQSIQSLIDEQQESLKNSLVAQQNSINEKIGQIDNPFAGLKETFEEGIAGIKSAFEAQNTTIAEMLAAQKSSLDDALKAQQEAILQKFREGPNHLKALSDIATTLEKLNKAIDKNSNSEDSDEQKSSVFDKIMKYALPIGTCGTFLALLALIAILLFDIKL